VKENFLSRSRKFDPKNFFFSVLNLAASTNQEGLSTALRRAWQNCGLGLKQTPAKSSLSEYREKVSFEFFRDIWRKDVEKMRSSRKKFRGYFIYAIDGDDLDLPATKDVLANGYRGYPIQKRKETHYPKMYTAQVVDVISGIVVDFKQASVNQEVIVAREMARNLEKNSITIYDRLHCGYLTAKGHFEDGSYFLIRVKSKNLKNPIEVKNFCQSKKRSRWIDLGPNLILQKKDPNLLKLKVRLVKVYNPRSQEDIVLMTNILETKFTDQELGELYQRRWGIESSFKDLTSTLKMNQWHSHKINSILQEIYALFWLVNQVRIQIAQMVDVRRWLGREYQKANFKFCIHLVVDNMTDLVRGRTKQLQRELIYWLLRSVEKRTHLSRNYPRQLKRFGKKYPNASKVQRRP